jgi:preprotein translocase subunit YajC
MYGNLQDFAAILIAQAEPATGQQDAMGMFAPLLIMVGIFYFLVMRPAAKERKTHQHMLDALKRGDEVVTASGILGRVTDIGEPFVTIEIARNVKIKVVRTQIAKKYVEAKQEAEAKPAKA